MMTTFQPPERLLLGPGPTNVSPRVLEALSRPTIGHLDPEFLRMMDELRTLLQYVFRTRNPVTFVVSGPGTAGMEAAVVNLVEPGDKVVVCKNGYFGERLQAMVERCGGQVVPVEFPWGRAVDPQKVEDTLKAHPDTRVVACVHAETSTGALSDVKTLAQVAHRYGALILVDAVTSLGGVPVEVDAWDLDVVYSGSQKCLSCVPGLAPVTVNARAMEVIRRRRTPVQSWFMDITLLTAYWHGETRRAYHHTAPVNALYALHEALRLIQEEGLEAVWARHHRVYEMFRPAVEALGLAYLTPEEERVPHLNVLQVPEGVDEAVLRRRLLTDFGIEIGGGLGRLAGQVWRIGLMGVNAHPRPALYALYALEQVLKQR